MKFWSGEERNGDYLNAEEKLYIARNWPPFHLRCDL